MRPVSGMPEYPWLEGDMLWAEPDLESLRRAMRDVYENRELASARGRLGREHMLRHFSWPTRGRRLVAAIEEISRIACQGDAPFAVSRVLFVSPVPTHPADGGNHVRLLPRRGLAAAGPRGDDPPRAVVLRRSWKDGAALGGGLRLRGLSLAAVALACHRAITHGPVGPSRLRATLDAEMVAAEPSTRPVVPRESRPRHRPPSRAADVQHGHRRVRDLVTSR